MIPRGTCPLSDSFNMATRLRNRVAIFVSACQFLSITDLKQQDFISIADYLAGEEISDVNHSGLDATIPLPEIEAVLPLTEIYERVEISL